MIYIQKTSVIAFDDKEELSRIASAYTEYPFLKEAAHKVTTLFSQGDLQACYLECKRISHEWNELKKDPEFARKLDEDNMAAPFMAFIAEVIADIMLDMHAREQFLEQGDPEFEINLRFSQYSLIKKG